MENEFPVDLLVLAVAVLLLIAAGILALSRWLRVPFTVLLVLTGIGLGWLARQPDSLLGPLANLTLSPEVILFVFLPTLIFESAFHLDIGRLRRSLVPVLILAGPGLILSTAIIGTILAGMTWLTLPVALLLGAILSATDPVAVIALFRQLGAPQRLTILVEGESLFNDATAIVLAHLLIGAVVAGGFTASLVGWGVVDFVVVFAGGVLVGWIMALVFGWVLGRVVADSFIEISLTTVLAYLSFLVAEEMLHVSGVMATVAAGLTIGNWGRAKISHGVRGFMNRFWEYMATMANALIFLLVGLRVELSVLVANWRIIALTIVAMLLSRAVVVFGLAPLAGRVGGGKKIRMGYQTVMYWGGLRGAIALAIALSLTGFDQADTIVAVVMGAVLFTLLVNGMTIEPLVRRLGLDKPPVAERLTRTEGLLEAKLKAQEAIPGLIKGGMFSSFVADRVSQRLAGEISRLRGDLQHIREHELASGHERQILFLRSLAIEKTHYQALHGAGHLTERAYRALIHSVDLQQEELRQNSDLPKNTLYGSVQGWVARLGHLLVEHLLAWSPLPEYLREQRVSMDYEIAWGRYQSSGRVLREIDGLAAVEAMAPQLVEQVRERYTHWHDRAKSRLDGAAEQFPEFAAVMQERLASRLLSTVECHQLEAEAQAGTLPEGMAEQLVHDLSVAQWKMRGADLRTLRVSPDELLRKLPMFQTAPTEEVGRVVALLKPHTVPDGTTIIRQGDAGDSLFLISRGVIRISRHEDGQPDHDLATLVAGDFFGEMALLHHQPRTATCRAVTPAALYELVSADFRQVLESCPEIRKALMAEDRRRAEAIGLDQDPVGSQSSG